VCFSPDGSILYSSDGLTLRAWDADAWGLLRAWPLAPVPGLPGTADRPREILCMTCAGGGRFLALWEELPPHVVLDGRSRTVRVFDLNPARALPEVACADFAASEAPPAGPAVLLGLADSFDVLALTSTALVARPAPPALPPASRCDPRAGSSRSGGSSGSSAPRRRPGRRGRGAAPRSRAALRRPVGGTGPPRQRGGTRRRRLRRSVGPAWTGAR